MGKSPLKLVITEDTCSQLSVKRSLRRVLQLLAYRGSFIAPSQEPEVR
ncbi:hypothetical protein AB0758_49325 [Tolypothrix bouteillei VB521301_2]